MNLLPETERIQSGLAQYCRTGEVADVTGAKADRLPHYRRLVFNVVNDMISSAYPITKKYLEQEEWEQLMHRFFAEHQCVNPQVWKMPFEFYEYVKAEELHIKHKYKWLIDLLYFEWMEIEVHTMPDEKLSAAKPEGNYLTDVLAVNPEYRIIQTAYPVHVLPPDKLNDKKDRYYILIFRQADSGNVQFFDVSEVLAYIICAIDEGKNLLNILNELAFAYQLKHDDELQQQCIEFIKALQQKGFVTGFKA